VPRVVSGVWGVSRECDVGRTCPFPVQGFQPIRGKDRCQASPSLASPSSTGAGVVSEDVCYPRGESRGGTVLASELNVR
jgi:hypothetical protein